MGIFSWFSKSSSPDYESVLARLASDINDAKIHLSELRLRERRFSLLINLYGVAVWGVWVALWYMNGLPWGLVGLPSESVEARAIGAGGIIGGPVFLWTLNRLLHFFFARRRNSEETHLRSLLTKQRKQLEDIKKATNYDSTRKLIEQYDEYNPGFGPNGPMTPTRQGPGTPSPKGSGKKSQAGTPQGTPRAPGHLVGAGGTPQQPATPVPVPPGVTAEQAAAMQMQLQSIQPVLPTPDKKWYDRLVDSILGDDPSQGSQSKYALVCESCFSHNGLVGSKYEWERMQWICPKCNHLNPSPLSRLKEQPGPSHIATSQSAQSLQSAPSPSPASHLARSSASPRPRRQLSDRSTPRTSRLGKEVFTASDDDDETSEASEAEGKDRNQMEVDEDK